MDNLGMTMTFIELTIQTFEAYDATCVNVINWQGMSVNTFGPGIRKIISLFGTKLKMIKDHSTTL